MVLYCNSTVLMLYRAETFQAAESVGMFESNAEESETRPRTI